MKVDYGTSMDIESWMELVKLVSWNLPGLETESDIEDHRKTVLRFMDEKRALCVKEADAVVGVLLLSKKHNMICCLAVAPEYRRNGIASLLLQKALANWTAPEILLLPPSVTMTRKVLLPELSTKSLVL